MANDNNHVSIEPVLIGSVVDRNHGDSFFDERGVEWVKLKAAAKDTKQKERNVRLWIMPDEQTGRSKVPGRQLKDRANAPWYVDIEALRTFVDDRKKRARERLARQLGIPVKDLPEDALESDLKESPVALPVALATSVDVISQLREFSEDWRKNAERVFTEQLEHERSRRAAAEEKVVELEVQLALKNVEPEEHHGILWHLLHGWPKNEGLAVDE